VGLEMRNLIKKILKEEMDDLDWIRDVSGEIPEITDENKFLVLVNLLGVNEVFGDVTGFDDEDTDFEQNRWDHYGIDTFTLNNGEEWAVGTERDYDDALYNYWYDFVDHVGIEGVYNVEDYLTMTETNRRLFAAEMADNYVYELSDEETIEDAGYEEEWEELEEKIEELEDQRDGIDTSIDDQMSDLEVEKENLVDRAREIVRDKEYDNWYDCLGDPYQCLVREHGWYMGADDLIRSGNADFDREEFARDNSDSGDYSDLSSYDSNWYEESGYIAMRLS
jgi:hypothetical protein